MTLATGSTHTPNKGGEKIGLEFYIIPELLATP
jgi:hypothetical protein